MNIAQTFITNELNSTIDSIMLTAVGLYFKTKSSSASVQVQIRTTENGFPTQYQVPYGSAILSPSQVNISSDASQVTNFIFDNPISLLTNTQYAIVVVPAGGDPNYTLWTATFGQTDVSSGNIINVNNPLGNLFAPSNDLVYTPLTNQSLKYDLYRADMTSFSGSAVFTNSDVDFFYYKRPMGSFIINEAILISNSNINLARLTISGSNSFSTGTIVYQSNGTANLAQGNVVFCNTSLMLLNAVNGNFVNAATASYTIQSASNSNIIAAPTSANQSVIASLNSNTISVPFADSSLIPDFAINNYLYVQTHNWQNTFAYQITNVDSIGNTISFGSGVAFADSNCNIGRIKGDGQLSGSLASIVPKLSGQASLMAIANVSCNSSLNFANSEGQLLIGLSSGASVISLKTADIPYEQITPTFTGIAPNLSSLNWGFKGVTTSKSIDSSYNTVQVLSINEMTDENRMVMSRSNELQNPAGSIGNKTLYVRANLTSSDSKITPYLDLVISSSTLTHNLIENANNLFGYNIQLANYNGSISVGDTIWQNNGISNTYGTVISTYNGTVKLNKIQSSNSATIPYFVANGTSTITSVSTSNSFVINSIKPYSETLFPDKHNSSRYISKTVVLNQGQDAEDLITYLTAYRPQGTNFIVYSRVLGSSDKTNFNSRPWGIMPESNTSVSLQSSLVNTTDYIELQYGFPESIQIFSQGANCTANSVILNMPISQTNQNLNVGDFVYVHDNSSSAFNVRRIQSIATGNTSSVNLTSNLSITSSNAAIGIIPGLLNSYTPFKYDGNNGVVRYIDVNDNVYDSFINFAMKIVFLSNNPAIVPKLTDMRCIALQV